MAGIGFSLRDLARRDDVLGTLRAFMHATLVAAGPWLVTILCLGTLSIVATDLAADQDVAIFRIVVIYNFGFSLTLTGPVAIGASTSAGAHVECCRSSDRTRTLRGRRFAQVRAGTQRA